MHLLQLFYKTEVYFMEYSFSEAKADACNCYSCFIKLKCILWNIPSLEPRLMHAIVTVVL